MGNTSGRARPKHIKLVKDLYPDKGQPQNQPQNLKPFLRYAEKNPQFLGHIVAYMDHRVRKHIRKGDKQYDLMTFRA